FLSVVLKRVWSPLIEGYPAVPIADDAVQRHFQSYRIGLVKLGSLVHTAVDEHYLHLMPAKFGRMLGMQPASVPWEAIEPVRLQGTKYAVVKIGSITVTGPSWALGLAFGEESP
ncbi:hypothetical protein MNBD_PLANCTO03-2158, partial [hydrothermal vent metagenome]